MTKFKEYLKEDSDSLKDFKKVIGPVYTFLNDKIKDIGDAHKKAEKRQDVLGAALVELEEVEKKVTFILKQL